MSASTSTSVTSSILAYLGPPGTFTEAATQRMPGVEHLQPVPYATVATALKGVRDGSAAAAVVPLENSVEGSVNATLDQLIRGSELRIRAEVLVPVEFSLMARAGTTIADIGRIVTHPVAEAQCRRWVAEHLPSADVVMATSTAAAASAVAEAAGSPTGEVAVPVQAAIASPTAATHYGLSVLATNIGEDSDAVTRFVLVTLPGPPPGPTGSDKTSFVAYLRSNHPGALLELLEQCATRGVNLTRIESRPTGDGMGQYCFVADAEGHLSDLRVGEALMGLRRVCADVRFLGSYPRADGVIAPVQHGTANTDFHDAATWLASLG